MFGVSNILKRIEALESSMVGGQEIKVFVYYAERTPPYWKPEDPKAWQQSHSRGKVVLLTVRNCRR